MEPAMESLPPIRPAPEGRPTGTSLVLLLLFVGLFLLLCILASDQAINYSIPLYEGPGSEPWWANLAYPALIFSWIAWSVSMIFAYALSTSSKKGCSGPISLLGTLNILLATLLFFMCLYTFLVAALSGA